LLYNQNAIQLSEEKAKNTEKETNRGPNNLTKSLTDVLDILLGSSPDGREKKTRLTTKTNNQRMSKWHECR